MIHESAGDERFPLRNRPDAIVLGPDGFTHPRSPRREGRLFTCYVDLTHLVLSDHQLWIATRDALHVLPRALFVSRDGPERLLSGLVRRVASLPDGGERLARMAALDALARSAAPPRATWTLAAVCLVVFLLDQFVDPYVSQVGYFSPLLVGDGDWWRVLTANLLHAFPLHLVVNLIGLLVAGRLLERSLGTARTICVMLASAVGSMLLSGLLVNDGVEGVSGVVFGLAGAVLWLELRHAAELPAWWRFPRPFLHLVIVAFAFDAALGFYLPFIAGEAHLGGFAAGVLAAAVVTRSLPLGPVSRASMRAIAGLATAATVLAVAAGAWELRSEPDYPARHAARISNLPGVPPMELNNHAWQIAIDEDASQGQMEAALLLAERAVGETAGLEATILDTLAEVQFRLGQSQLAIETIDRAIAQEPDEGYYREQRRRFTGERAADDRPPDPALRRPDRTPDLPRDEDGLTV